MRDKNHMNFLIDGEKTIWKIPYVFMTKTLNKLGTEQNKDHLWKGHSWQHKNT